MVNEGVLFSTVDISSITFYCLVSGIKHTSVNFRNKLLSMLVYKRVHFFCLSQNVKFDCEETSFYFPDFGEILYVICDFPNNVRPLISANANFSQIL